MKTIAEIKAEFAAADMSSYPALYEIYKEDTRSGVQKTDRTVPQKGSRCSMSRGLSTACVPKRMHVATAGIVIIALPGCIPSRWHAISI